MTGSGIYGTDAVSAPPDVVLPTDNNNWFYDGNGTTINGTRVPAYWFNKVGAEIVNAIGALATLTESGVTYNPSTYNQLAILLSSLVTAPQVTAAIAAALDLPNSLTMPGYFTFPGGLIVQWGSHASSTGNGGNDGAVVNFPLEFPTGCFVVLASNTILSSANHVNAAIIDQSSFHLSNTVANGFTDTANWIAIGH
jgi:hypothetical protein